YTTLFRSAVFGDATYEFSKQLELDAAIRYDEDQRQNTTRTPTEFLPDSTAKTGEVRKHTFDAAQPKGTLRYKPADNVTLYGGWSRGFRSGGFNQTGVGAVAQASGNLGMHDPTVVGNKPPLLTKNTVNAGFQVHEPLGGGLNGVLRLDYQMIGRTWWDPKNLTSRDPIDLLGLRAGVEADRWSVTAWSKNLTNKLYNAEFSPGGFLWRAMPRQYGVEFGYRF